MDTNIRNAAYIDECGNFGFDFEKSGTSTHYIVCSVVVKNENIAQTENRVNTIRRNNFGNGEMKSSSIGGNHKKRLKVLSELLTLDFSLIILIADKQLLYKDSPLSTYKGSFVKYLHQKLYESMYRAYPKLKIIEDEYGTSEFQQGYRKYITDNQPELNLFNDYGFDYVDSRDSNIVQIADIIAGSVMQRIIDASAPDTLKIFCGKVIDVINFPKTYLDFIPELTAKSSYDQKICKLAERCAISYIEENKSVDDEDIRLRILFLRQLIFTVQNVSFSKYIHSSEITKRLTEVSEKKITRNILYRKIVAPLRDAGVLVASSDHGYKLPTCASDIFVYLKQTNKVVSPMLFRIQKCRELILMETEGDFDILAHQALKKYRHYLDD